MLVGGGHVRSDRAVAPFEARPQMAGHTGNDNWDVWADLDNTNTLQTRYLRGDAIDQLFARIGSGGAGWFLPDRLGSVRDITDANWAVQDHLNYDGFGNVTSESNSTVGGRYKYTAREFDSATGLQYNRGRYYLPDLGRWIEIA